MKFWIVMHPSNTRCWVYTDKKSAEKRLSSGLKRPVDYYDWKIIEVQAV